MSGDRYHVGRVSTTIRGRPRKSENFTESVADDFVEGDLSDRRGSNPAL